MKQYKACAPEQTIERIRRILAEFGIFLKEISRQNADELFSCRLVTINDGLEPLDIGTNGKGSSYLYALASGYAEYMERLQSNFLFLFYNKSTTGEHTLEQIWNKWKKEIKEFIPEADTLGKFRKIYAASLDGDRIRVREYLNAMNGERVLLPEALFNNSSNGLAAGNTPVEAILQGCCEIFERYAMRRIYVDRLTPPDIPTELFSDTTAGRIIKQLENERGLSVTVKDCSLGKGLPVVGVLIIDKKQGKYQFRYGCDFNLYIALERTLTEMYQGGNNIFSNPQVLRHVSEEELSPANFLKIFQRFDGQWPASIFADKPSWEFAGLNPAYGQSDEQDLQFCRDICRSFGTEMYVCDNSFLGFPAYSIIIPAMSSVKFGFDYLCKSKFSSYNNIKRKLFADGAPSAEKLIEVIEPRAAYAIEKGAEFDLCKAIPAYANEELSSITPRVFLCLTACHKGDMDEAYRQICEQCRDEKTSTRFHHALADWIALAREGTAQQTAISILTRKYGQGVALKAAFWLAEPEAALQNSGLLYHFNPQNWGKSKSSHLAAYEKISAKLAQRAAAYQPDYDALAKIFIKE